MTIQVIEGKKSEIAEKIAGMTGEVSRAIVWVEEPAPVQPAPLDVDAILAEMQRDTVSVGNVDDSREAIYTRLEGE